GAKPKVEPVVIQPEPPNLKAGEPISPAALVSRPTAIQGVRSWTLETRAPRGESENLAFSPDNRRLASAATDGMVRIWKLAGERRRLERILVGHAPNRVQALNWSPDGQILASGGWDAELRLREAETG